MLDIVRVVGFSCFPVEQAHAHPANASVAWFLARDSMLSHVRQSHGWINRKQLKVWLCNFHRTIAPSI